MLESVLADVLTRVLGQYLHGIDRDHVHFGAWSGLVELRSVALRPEALAVLFESLGVALPVTVESGFIGLLRLVVPWKAIGTTPVQIHMQDITVVARPVRGDGSDDSQLLVRDRRIKRAKLNTDDAVREASWGVNNEQDQQDQPSKPSWSSWLVSDELRATIVNNIQIHLSDIIVRFEDPYSNPKSPYVTSLHCESLKIVSADNEWQEAFVENSEQKNARKLLEIKGFHVDWAPITSAEYRNSLLSPDASASASASLSFDTPELLRQYVSYDGNESVRSSSVAPRSLIHRVDGSMQLKLSSETPSATSVNFRMQEPSADLDIIFPNVFIDLNDVQYACIMQTSLYFARIATRGFRPTTSKARWRWAVDQLLPGCTARFARALRFSPEGLAETRRQRDSYIDHRTKLLKARRTSADEPKKIGEELERIEDTIDFEEILAYRDAVDAQIEKGGHFWIQETENRKPSEVNNGGTTTRSFWSMLGYKESSDTATNDQRTKEGRKPQELKRRDLSTAQWKSTPSSSTQSVTADQRTRTLTLRAAFLLRSATMRMSEKGYPSDPIPRVELNFRDFRIGVLFSSASDLIIEALLGAVEAWDLQREIRMAYSRLAPLIDSAAHETSGGIESHGSYPRDVSGAIESIRNGSNPAKQLLEEDSYDEDDTQTYTSDDGFLDDDSIQDNSDTEPARRVAKLRQKGHNVLADETCSTFHITKGEFLGSPGYSGAPKYIAAFRYSQVNEDGDSTKHQSTSLDVSVATMEAVVDGPKGSFLWGLKFWQPKGLVQDPIMAFLGAAAGARIAELRTELEQTLLADAVPMKVNAVILAPRFIIPSSKEDAPSVVVNMGTLGVCTSNSSPPKQGRLSSSGPERLRYSNYVLTLDDLGMYYSPDLSTALSRNLQLKVSDDGSSDKDELLADESRLKEIERIIRPFSLRFVLQTLRDPRVVQMAHGSSKESNSQIDGIAKLRVRGNIPQLSLILTRKAFQHLLATAQGWSEGLKPANPSHQTDTSRANSRSEPWQNIGEDGVTPAPSQAVMEGVQALTNVISPPKDLSTESSQQPISSPPALASYSATIVIQSVSIELREDMDARLVTAVASELIANVVKRSKTKLRADLSLRSWSVTDDSCDSTVAFRNLLYSGTRSGSKEKTSENSHYDCDSGAVPESGKENFVSIQYILDLTTQEQQLFFHFLSLHMNCVRESYLRLISFFDRVRKYVSHRRRHRRQVQREKLLEKDESSDTTSALQIPTLHENAGGQKNEITSQKASIVSKFDGFTFQLVASAGVIAVFEMKDSCINFMRDYDGSKKASGSFGSFSIKDFTAPLPEHVSVINYDSSHTLESVGGPDNDDNISDEKEKDSWLFLFPRKSDDPYQLSANFEGIRVLFLYRFTLALQEYISAFADRARPAFSSFIKETKAEFPESEQLMSSATYSSISSKVFVTFDLRDLAIRIPRHSTCLSEALTFNISEMHIDNVKEQKDLAWFAKFDDIQGAAQFILAKDDVTGKGTSVSSTFFTDCAIDMLIQPNQKSEASSDTSTNVLKIASMSFRKPVRINLSEAQYTVLYFVLTENIAETVSGNSISTSLYDMQNVPSDVETLSDLVNPSSSPGDTVSESSNITEKDDIASGTNDDVTKPTTMEVEVDIPIVSLEVSRGWDVLQERCKVLGAYLANVNLGLSVSTQRRAFEFAGTLLSVADLRTEAEPVGQNMITQILQEKKSECGPNASAAPAENISLYYEKVGMNRPSIGISLDKLHIEMVPELLRDLTYLAIPGWPFLKTSGFAPECEYIGRSVTLALRESQIILPSEETTHDKRALVLTGEFESNMDWKRNTGGKTISLYSKKLEMSAVNEVPSMDDEITEIGYGLKEARATPFGKSQSPLIYPTDAVIEFVGPNVDDEGCRIHVSIDAALCVVCTSEVPVLRAISNRLSSLKPSYLSRRHWLQPEFGPDAQQSSSLNQKEKQKQEAKDNLNISMTVPVSRYLVTDDSGGRFVPVIEVRLTSLSAKAHGTDMVQADGQVAMDLFNPQKGCWEPALEHWNVLASLSNGHSGTRAFILRSDERLNLNFSPSTVAAAQTVAKALREATGKPSPKGSSNVVHNQTSALDKVSDRSDNHRPSVAAFCARNELGIPIMICIPGQSNRISLSSNSEIEIGAQSDALISTTDQKTRDREEALRCSILIPSFAPRDLSASEAGKQSVTFFPQSHSSHSVPDLHMSDAEVAPLEVLWDVALRNGVPLCTIRSPFRILNETTTKLDIIVTSSETFAQDSFNFDDVITIEPGENYPLSLNDIGGVAHLRPAIPSSVESVGRTATPNRPFQWSAALPQLSWLLTLAQKMAIAEQQPSSANARSTRNVPLIECRSYEGGEHSFFFKLIPSTSKTKVMGSRTSWLDLSVRAPIIIANKLPGPLSYRICHKQKMSSSSSNISVRSDTVLATGVIGALDNAHLHISDESLNTSFLSLAFDNKSRFVSPTDTTRTEQAFPSNFGPSACLQDIDSGRIKSLHPSPAQEEDIRGQSRKHFRAHVQPIRGTSSQFSIFAGFWIRNRSDTNLEICSRQSFYGPGSVPLNLRARPPHLEPDDYVCFEGPYLSIRQFENRSGWNQDSNQTNWWTSPSILEDINKPVSISISGRSLELEVRLSLGLDCSSHIVTIRNMSWLINSTSSLIQWCQQSALDAHGNCPTRLLKSLPPGKVESLHWNTKSNKQAIHLRLAEDDGKSDWIWSPAVPLDIGHSRELPAKMYRPKTHDQYIARIGSKEIAGGSRALVIYEEDRQNPPYRIVNLCKERAVAFSQIGSQERPWLIRAGKSTRYSWDDPLAPPSQRELSIRVLEKEDLTGKSPSNDNGPSRSRTSRAPPSTLNIDKVGDRVMVIGDPFDPPVVFNVSVDGATKIISLFDEGSDVEVFSSKSSSKSQSSGKAGPSNRAPDNDSSVPVVGWEDIGSQTGDPDTSKHDSQSDYPMRPSQDLFESSAEDKTDAAIFLNSIGISVVDNEPEELLYLSSTGLFLNYESSKEDQNMLVTIEHFQIDNQISRTPYPIFLWVPPRNVQVSASGSVVHDQNGGINALTVEIHRDLSMDDILMIRSFQALVCPCTISLEEGLVSKLLQFLDASNFGEESKNVESLEGLDDEGHAFSALVPGLSKSKSLRQEHNGSTSSRIYVHNFKIAPTAIRLTSTGSGAAIAKAAGLNASAVRAIVGLLLNVENCKFDFPSLCVQNVFDSLHHFGVLIRTYYVTQLDNQRIKLLTSNSLVGNPAALFDAVGTGARDFLSEPGRAKGSADFFVSVGRGSKSLFTHTVGGIVGSVSSIPRAVSTGLERAVGDNDYLAERERIRGSTLTSGHRGNTRNPAQGFATGALSLAHGISSGVTGFIREPMQGAKQGGAGGLLKGIGKAFIGGVAKPVAGAIDLVAEPAAGLSRQIADIDASNDSSLAVPDRPPRAFRGKSQRIEQFDRRYSTGVWLLKACSIFSGAVIQSRLIDWVELSDRADRKSKDADMWVWFVVQRFSRCMPGSKKQLRSDLKRHAYNQGLDPQLESRPEKIRVALLTEQDIVIASLDCKLVTMIPVWDDADYELIADGKELIIRATIVDNSNTKMESENFKNAQSLIHAPWDVVAPALRRKPGVGESTLDRIACGSVAAREDLHKSLERITGEKMMLRENQQQQDRGLREGMSGEEVAPVSSKCTEKNGREVQTLQNSEDWKMRDSESKQSVSLPGYAGKDRSIEGLQRVVEGLTLRGVQQSTDESDQSLRLVVANELDQGLDLYLTEGSLEQGQWRKEVPVSVKSLDAQVIEVGGRDSQDGGQIIEGNVMYKITDMNRGRDVGQIVLEFSSGRDAATSCTTKASKGFRAEFECEGGDHGTVIFKIRRAVEGEQKTSREVLSDREKSHESQNASKLEGMQVGTSGLSEDERLLQQLVELGFKYEDAVPALADAGGDIVKAVDLLTK